LIRIHLVTFQSELKIVVLPEFGHPYIIENVNGPVIPTHSWFYDAGVNDFMLKPIRLLEETTGPTVRVRINGAEFNVPASWNILVVDEETKAVDTVQITQCSSSNYKAFLMHPSISDYATSAIVLLDLYMREACVHTMIPKLTMMLHPVGQVTKAQLNRGKVSDLSYCCMLSPQDVGKHMNQMSAMEIVL
jgi:hypothetical protein